MQAGSLNFNFAKKLVKVVTFMCARGPAPHVARGRKHCKRMASLYKHMGKLQRAVTLILRHQAFFFFFFQGDLNTKQKKKLSRNHHIIELGA